MQNASIDLVDVFKTVTQSLEANQQNLNQADVYNQDHGTNMVETFHTITSALEKRKGNSDSAALAYAAKKLSTKATSSSGKQYAENLSRAALEFKGKKVDQRGALELLQTLIGSQGAQSGSSPDAGGDLMSALLGGMTGGQSSPQGGGDAGGDLMSALLGGMTGGQSSPQGGGDAGGDLMSALLGGMTGGQSSPQGGGDAGGDLMSALLGGMTGGQSSAQGGGDAGGDLMSALLGGMTGGQSSPQGGSQSSSSQGGLTLQNLLAAGMAYFQAKQSGQGNLQALIQAFVAGSGMGKSPHRSQSTELVVQSFLQALGG